MGITFFCERFFIFEKLELNQWIMLILGISIFWSDSLGIRFWHFLRIFENAWVALICVGDFWSKCPKMSKITFPTSWANQTRRFIWFKLNPRNFNPRKINFWGGFWVKTIKPQSAAPIRLVSKCSKFISRSFENTLKTSGDFPPTVSPTQKFKSRFSIWKF